jgi:type I restriction enzyme S subunit
MQQYSYKNSGIKWLGKVPEHWRVDRIKDHFRDDLGQINEKALSAIEVVKHYSIPAFDDNGQPEECRGEEISSGKKVLNGVGLLYSKLNCWKPRVWLYSVKKDNVLAVASTEFIGLRAPNATEYELRYIQYLLGSEGFTDSVKIYLTSVTNSHQRITPSTFVSQAIPLPPLPEQKAIAEYLDKACARIDRIIAIKEEQLRKIEGYYTSLRHKLITLGINNTDFISYDDDFLKKVPKHWKKQKLRYLLELKNGKLITNDELVDDGEIPVYGGNGIMGRTDKYNYDGELLILGRVGAKCGNVHYTNQKIWVSDNAISVRSIINYKYMYQLLTVIDLHRLASETAQPLLVGNNVKKLYVAIPPITEQNLIIEKIETAYLKTQNLKKKVSSQIITLQSYRKSLIHECVTGKKQVYTGELNTKEASV